MSTFEGPVVRGDDPVDGERGGGMIDAHRTDNCPRGHRCESCGREAPDLAVHALRLASLGVACLTLCPACATSTVAPPVTVDTAARLAAQHAAHLSHPSR